MTLEQQRDAAQAVTIWIAERHGDKVAHDWLWSCTPYPAGLPCEEMLLDGLALAVGETTLDALFQKTEDAIEHAMAAERMP